MIGIGLRTLHFTLKWARHGECREAGFKLNRQKTLAQKFSSFRNLFGEKKTWIASWGARKIFMHAENNAKRWCSSTRHNPRSVGLTSVPLSLSSFLQEYYFRLRCLVVKVVLPVATECYTQWYGSIHLTWRAKQQGYVFLWMAYRRNFYEWHTHVTSPLVICITLYPFH